ncbi:hypothetical protein HanXRQr2_Chr15g0687031 [Helianthus annuus]|uniref:Uncharacterized protein n=1 Tax=Helianthus annuus TaxID=4232 RepID=A0A9K3H2T7_HELAN|nr:hypothetical protein HanXRQr2_Chr15g0687031 [Helianthus annuus]KAJ0830753.1 hypothetical protein HanPSC8_Chr15g0659051 [Helianthus annuus]
MMVSKDPPIPAWSTLDTTVLAHGMTCAIGVHFEASWWRGRPETTSPTRSLVYHRCTRSVKQ